MVFGLKSRDGHDLNALFLKVLKTMFLRILFWEFNENTICTFFILFLDELKWNEKRTNTKHPVGTLLRFKQGLLNNGFWAKAQGRPRFERTFPKGSLFIVFLERINGRTKENTTGYFFISSWKDFEMKSKENQDQTPCRNATGFVE